MNNTSKRHVAPRPSISGVTLCDACDTRIDNAASARTRDSYFTPVYMGLGEMVSQVSHVTPEVPVFLSLQGNGRVWVAKGPCPFCGMKHKHTAGVVRRMGPLPDPNDYLGERGAPCKLGRYRLVPYGNKWEKGRYAR